MRLGEIVEETSKDAVIQEVIGNSTTGKWKEPFPYVDTKQFIRPREELSVASTPCGSVLLHQSRIVIPATLQQHVVDIAHEGHQGVMKTKQLLRENVWFPGINNLVETICKGCIPRLASTPQTTYESLNMTPLPEKPWTRVSADFCGQFPSGEYLLVIMDNYSRFPVVEILTSTSARAAIPKFDKILS